MAKIKRKCGHFVAGLGQIVSDYGGERRILLININLFSGTRIAGRHQQHIRPIACERPTEGAAAASWPVGLGHRFGRKAV